MDDLLLERAVESLRDAVGLRLLNKRETRRDAPEAQLVLVMVREVLRSVVHAQRQAARHASRDRPVQVLKAHRHRFERSEAAAVLADVPADALGVPVLDCDEYPAPLIFDGEYART